MKSSPGLQGPCSRETVILQEVGPVSPESQSCGRVLSPGPAAGGRQDREPPREEWWLVSCSCTLQCSHRQRPRIPLPVCRVPARKDSAPATELEISPSGQACSTSRSLPLWGMKDCHRRPDSAEASCAWRWLLPGEPARLLTRSSRLLSPYSVAGWGYWLQIPVFQVLLSFKWNTTTGQFVSIKREVLWPYYQIKTERRVLQK